MYLIRGSVGALALFLPIRRRIKKTKTKQNKLRLAAPTTTATAAATTSATNVFCFFLSLLKPSTLSFIAVVATGYLPAPSKVLDREESFLRDDDEGVPLLRS